MNEHEALVDEAARTKHTVVLLGGIDSGKSTLARSMLRAALAGGRASALVDSDVGQKTVGPPATVTLKMLRAPADLAAETFADADELSFVGSTSPEGHLLSMVTSVARLTQRARERGAEFVVLDTTGVVSGVYGQILKYHKVEMVQPDLVVGLQRGEELQPLLGVIQRFFGTQVVPLPIV
ncbi:MAG: Clp1/GlmU family protein, partial [Actinomycetota bacterium]